MRPTADGDDRARLLGLRTHRERVLVWTLSGGCAMSSELGFFFFLGFVMLLAAIVLVGEYVANRHDVDEMTARAAHMDRVLDELDPIPDNWPRRWN